MRFPFLVGIASTIIAGPANAAAADTLLVAQHCGDQARPCYTSLQNALDAAERSAADGWITIRIAPGEYREKPVVRRGKVRLVGSGRERTKIKFGAVAQTAGHYHRANWGTPGSATLTIDAADVSVSGMTIENTFDYLGNDKRLQNDPKKIGNPQGVAVLLDVHSDRVAIDRSSIIGYQDTLFANGGRAVVRRSLITGNVDFIFGDGQLLIEHSEIRTRARSAALEQGEFHSFIAAPSTPRTRPMGIVFYASHLTREIGVPDQSVALARPWHPTKRFPDGRYADPDAIGHAVFIDCVLDAHIHPDHWASMNGTARDGTMTSVFRPQDSRFHEAGSRGPGAKTHDIGMQMSVDANVDEYRKILFKGWRSLKK